MYSGKYDVLFPLAGVVAFTVSCFVSLDDDKSCDVLDDIDIELVTALCLCSSGCGLFDCRMGPTCESSAIPFDSTVFAVDCTVADFELRLKL